MDYTAQIIQLYGDVLDLQQTKFNVSTGRFKKAVHDINEAYSRNPNWQHHDTSKKADFNDPARRCAYLHKYAMVHSGLMCEISHRILRKSDIRRELTARNSLSLCSLGGGPGTEIVSMLFAMQDIFRSVTCDITVVDYSLEWKQVFESIISRLKTGRYGSVSDVVSNGFFGQRTFSYEYLSADLLNSSKLNMYKVQKSIKNADIITMIKFVSAAACDKTRTMIKKIFQTMKLGGMLLFVDNAAGGFDRMIREVAFECGMVTVFGPLKHYDYENPRFDVERYGYKSQFKTRVAIEMWKKTSHTPNNTTSQLQREFVYGPNRASTSTRNIRLNEEPQEEGCCSIM